MREIWLILAILGTIPALGGCATSGSLGGKEGSKVYGGTRLDATIISESLSPDSEVAKTEGLQRPVLLWAACCGMVDLPFSVIADTVMLPITLSNGSRNQGEDSPIINQAPAPQ